MNYSINMGNNLTCFIMLLGKVSSKKNEKRKKESGASCKCYVWKRLSLSIELSSSEQFVVI